MTSAYTTLAAVKAAMRVTDSIDDDLIQSVINAASSRIDNACNRVFAQSTGTRYYVANNTLSIPIDDLASSTVTIRLDGLQDGSWNTTLTAAQYQLEPLNNLAQGKPVRMVRLLNSTYIPYSSERRATVSVQGTWGWPSVPAEITEATRLMVIRQFRRFDSPLGVAGFGDLGVVNVRSIDPDIAALIAPFMLQAFA